MKIQHQFDYLFFGIPTFFENSNISKTGKEREIQKLKLFISMVVSTTSFKKSYKEHIIVILSLILTSNLGFIVFSTCFFPGFLTQSSGEEVKVKWSTPGEPPLWSSSAPFAADTRQIHGCSFPWSRPRERRSDWNFMVDGKYMKIENAQIKSNYIMMLMGTILDGFVRPYLHHSSVHHMIERHFEMICSLGSM